MKDVRHITSETVDKMVGTELGSDLWLNGMFNEIRRYPNEIPCEPGEIPSMIIPGADGSEKVEWGFAAGMSCLLQGENGEITVRRAGHFPACACLALLSLLADAGADEGKKIDVTLRVPENEETAEFRNHVAKMDKAMKNVTFTLKPADEEAQERKEPRTVIDASNSVGVVQQLQQIDVGRFAALVRCVMGSFSTGDDLTVADGDFKELQTHCPAMKIIAPNGMDIVESSGDLEGDTFWIMLAMCLPEGFRSTDLYIIKEAVTPEFDPEVMPERPVLHAESKPAPAAEAKAGASGSGGYVPDMTLTSQLVAIWLATGDSAYRDEYLRRMKICGLSPDTADKMLKFEENILKKFPRPELLDKDFIKKPMFTLKEPFLKKGWSYYAKHFELPLSYIVKLSDEAEWHFWNSHEKDLSKEVWGEIFALSDRNMELFGPFAMNLVNNMGWTTEQVNKFSYNEQAMLNRHRWGQGAGRAAQDPWNIGAEGVSFKNAAKPLVHIEKAGKPEAKKTLEKKHKPLAIALAVLLVIGCIAAIGGMVKKEQVPEDVTITDITSWYGDEAVTLGDLGVHPCEFEEITDCISISFHFWVEPDTEIPEEWAGYYRSEGTWKYAGSTVLNMDEMMSDSGTQMIITTDDVPQPVDAIALFPVIEEGTECSFGYGITIDNAVVRK